MSPGPEGCQCGRCRRDNRIEALGAKVSSLEAELAAERRIKAAIQAQAQQELVARRVQQAVNVGIRAAADHFSVRAQTYRATLIMANRSRSAVRAQLRTVALKLAEAQMLADQERLLRLDAEVRLKARMSSKPGSGAGRD